MFYPTETNSEFVEILNNSKTDAIDITNFKILYHTSTTSDGLVSISSEFILQPKQYAIILEGDYDFENGNYKDLIPSEALVLTIDDNSFGSRGMANTADRIIYLLDDNDDTLDVYTYSANNEEGVSDERNIATEDNWSNSVIVNGTPGFRNSISPKENDLTLLSFTATNTNVTVGNDFQFTLKIKNVGTLPASNISLNIYKDENQDGLPQQEEVLSTEIISEIATNDSLEIKKDFENNSVGKNNFIAEVEFDLDEYLENNIKTISVFGVEVVGETDDLIINEIMFAPKSPEPEWIEIYNRSEESITIDEFQIADAKDTNSIVSNIIIEPNGFFVIADDISISEFYPNIENLIITNLPTFNNSEDKIILIDSFSRMIDSVFYESNWGGSNGKSLERIDPLGFSADSSNWRESLTSATPGQINSVTQKDFDLKIETAFSVPKLPIINDLIQLEVKMKNIGKKLMQFNIDLFVDANIDSVKDELIETSNQLQLNPNDSLIYKFDFIDTLKIKQGYIFEISAEDDDITNNIFYYSTSPGYPPKSILVNEIKYSPKNDEPEWVELYNNSEHNIDLENWLIGDVLTKPVFKPIFDQEYLFPSKTFLVISKSGSIYNFYRNILSPVQNLKFANLNNDEDGVVIKDNRNVTIDSVKYSNSFGGENGESLERVSLEFESTNPNNWKPTLDIEKGTPGRINSVTPKNYDLTFTEISTIPKFPLKNDKIKITVKIVNRGNFNVDNFSILFFYGEHFAIEELEIINNLSLTSKDSLVITTTKEITIIDTLFVSAEIDLVEDEDRTNNLIYSMATAGFNQNSVLINEVMFNPKDGEPTWIEITNNSDSIINISGWSIGDLKTQNLIIDSVTPIHPNELLILSDFFQQNFFSESANVIQTNLPDFSSKKDAVVLYDFRNAIIDSMSYDAQSNFGKGISLERISLSNSSTDISNWIFSLNETGNSAGEENSIVNIPSFSFSDIIINEIMYEPDSSNSEFLELYNNSTNSVELGGWRVEDKNGDSFSVNDISKILKPNEYFLIASDSTIIENYFWLEESENISIKNTSSLDFTNTEKIIYLKDFRDNIIDSIHYSKNWHNTNLTETKNISLELINFELKRDLSSSWNSSVDDYGATPGKQNSIYVEKLVSKSKLNISPNPFSPDNDGFEDYTFINYKLTQPIAQVRLKIFDSRGRLVRTLANNKPSGNEGTITFDGLDENKNPLRIGIYIVFLEALNSANQTLDVVKEVVVVARKL
ncbi:MAG: hypothetical protein GY936_17140 [Ignavibacteriae bacterium]|nr:hypothetical protein [Ignavibacteriota bacterium]